MFGILRIHNNPWLGLLWRKMFGILSNKSKVAVNVYRWLYILAVFIGPYMTVKAVWTIADIFNGLMAIPNIIALFTLSGVVAKETKEHFEKKKQENK